MTCWYAYWFGSGKGTDVSDGFIREMRTTVVSFMILLCTFSVGPTWTGGKVGDPAQTG